MKRTVKILSLSLATVFLLWRCKDTYVSPYVSPPTGYLVVEGYITGNDVSQFTLSRTIPLSATTPVPKETKALVQVEGSDNSIYPFTEQGTGVYVGNTMNLSTTVKYRLRITTTGREIYLSDFVPYKPTPSIDSISWKRDASQVTIYANTHDPANATHYYQWNYDEAWEYHSAELSMFEYKGNTTPVSVIPRPDADQIYRCWQTPSSTTLLLASTTKLSQDVVYEQPLTHIAVGSQQISVLYSILVRQYALTVDGYNYLTLMQKNTESLGSIFDAQPSILIGNIHCLSDPTKQVLGFISAGTVTRQRIFIANSQVFPWTYFISCIIPDTVVANKPDSFSKFYSGQGYIPVIMHFNLGGIFDGYTSNLSDCIDCRLHGGNNVKPSYWPN